MGLMGVTTLYGTRIGIAHAESCPVFAADSGYGRLGLPATAQGNQVVSVVGQGTHWPGESGYGLAERGITG